MEIREKSIFKHIFRLFKAIDVHIQSRYCTNKNSLTFSFVSFSVLVFCKMYPISNHVNKQKLMENEKAVTQIV